MKLDRGLLLIALLVVVFVNTEAQAQWINDTTASDATKIAIGKDGSIWTVYKWYHTSSGSNRSTGVQRYANGTWTRYGKADGLADDSVRDLTIDPAGDVWVAGKNGLSRFNGSQWSTYTIKDTATDRREFVAIACDSSGVIWVTSLVSTFIGILHGNVQMDQQPAIHKFDGDIWTTYWPQEGFNPPQGEIPFIECDRGRNVYAFGYQAAVPPTFGRGFYHFDGLKWKTLDEGGHSTSANAKQPTGLACAPDGSVWLTFIFADDNKLVPGNIHRFNGGGWSGYDTSIGSPQGTPQALGIDRRGHKWLGYNTASGSGVWVLDEKIVRHYTQSDNPIVRHGVSAIAFTGSDAYLATPHGLAILKGYSSNVKAGSAHRDLQVYPNPVNRFESIRVTLPERECNRMEIRDALGNVVQNDELEAGSKEVRVKLDDVQVSGLYTLTFFQNSEKVGFTRFILQ